MSSDDTERETLKPEPRAVEVPTSAAVTHADDAAGDLPSDEDDEWAVRGPAKGVRLTLPTAVLVAVVLIAAGFWGGAFAQRHHASSATGAGAGGGFAARFRSARGGGAGGGGAASFFAGGGGAGGATGSSAASGTISVVDRNTLYILTSAGALVKATLGPSTTITRTASTPAVGLRPGDTVDVQGSTSTNGDVSATSVTATGP
jgi:hypothetical protein